MALPAAVSILAQIGIAFVANYVSRRLQKNLRQANVAQLDPVESSRVINIAYGRAAVSGNLAYTNVGNRYAEPPMANGDWLGTLEDGEFENNRYVMLQHVLSAGEIESVTGITLNNVPINFSPYLTRSIANVVKDGESSELADGFAVLNSITSRDANSKFTGLSYGTTVLFWEEFKPLFPPLPEIVFYCKGVKPPSITSSGLGARVYTPNSVAVLADYLTSEYYGPGWTAANLDLPSWADAFAHYDEIVLGKGTVLWSRPFPDDLNAELHTNYDTWQDYYNALGYDDINHTNVLERFEVEFPNATPPDPQTRLQLPILRGEFNGVIATNVGFRDAINMILDTMPGLVMYRSRTQGKWTLKHPDFANTVQEQVVKTIDATNSTSNPTVRYPDANVKYNEGTIRFINQSQDYTEDSVSFAIEHPDIAARLKTEDRDVVLNLDTDAIGTLNAPTASARLTTEILESRLQ